MTSPVTYSHLLIITLMLCSVSSERMKNKIYDSIEGVAPCFRRLNGTHQFGCSSHRLGNVGVLHMVNDSGSMEWLLNEGEASPYMVILYPRMFTWDVVMNLSRSGKVNGIALLNNGSRPEQFTHDDTCPNRYSGLYLLNNQTCDSSDVWNPLGSRLLLEDIGLPIFYIKKDFEKIEQCYLTFNSLGRNKVHDHSLCAMEMNSFMFATTDSATCIRRSNMITNFNRVKFCDPLGGRNVWATLFPRSKNSSNNEQNSSVWVLAARMDSASLFDGVAPGAVSPATGIVSLLATAHILAHMFNDTKETPKQNVLFTLLHGESFDYIGSSRMVWDMRRGVFPGEEDDAVADQPPPLRLEHLAYFVELSHLTDQRGGNAGAPALVLHTTDKNSVRSQMSTSSFVEELSRQGSKLGLSFQTRADGHLPPASLQSFLAHAPHDAASPPPLPGVVIADHFAAYKTQYYHGVFDNAQSLHYEYQHGNLPLPDSVQTFVANFSLTLAKTLYTMLTSKNYPDSIDVDAHMVDELFHCYVDTVNCSVFQEASHNLMLNDDPPNLYVGVGDWREPNYLLTTMTGLTLAYLTGKSVNRTEEDCRNNPQQQVFQYIWMKGKNEDSGVCIETTMNYSSAVSPAFEEPDYDWSSGQFSTWTESTWREMKARIFLKPSRAYEIKILSVGAVVFSLSFILVYFLNARSHILFGNTLGSGAC